MLLPTATPETLPRRLCRDTANPSSDPALLGGWEDFTAELEGELSEVLCWKCQQPQPAGKEGSEGWATRAPPWCWYPASVARPPSQQAPLMVEQAGHGCKPRCPPNATWEESLIYVCLYATATCMCSESIWISFDAPCTAQFSLDACAGSRWSLMEITGVLWSEQTPPKGRDFRLALPNRTFSFSASGKKRAKPKRLAGKHSVCSGSSSHHTATQSLLEPLARGRGCTRRVMQSVCGCARHAPSVSTIINLSSSFNLKSHSKHHCFIQASSKITSQAQAHAQQSLRLMELLQSELITVQTQREQYNERLCVRSD